MASSTFQKLLPLLALGFAALPVRADFTLTNNSSQMVYVRGQKVRVDQGSLHLQIHPGTPPGPPREAWGTSVPTPSATFEGIYKHDQSLSTLVCALPPGAILTVACEDEGKGGLKHQGIGLVLCPETKEGFPADAQAGWYIEHFVIGTAGFSVPANLDLFSLPPETRFKLDFQPNNRDISLSDNKITPTCVIL